jgi:hypothetical protein
VTPRILGWTALGVTLALVVAGCGDPSPEDRYAERVCSVLLLHGQELLDTYEVVNNKRAAPGRDARVSLLLSAMAGADTTWRLRRKLNALAVPDTDGARKAAAYIDATARSADSWVVHELQKTRRLPKNITLVQSTQGLDQLEVSLMTAFLILGSYDIVEVRVPELWPSFEKAESCKDFGTLGQD